MRLWNWWYSRSHVCKQSYLGIRLYCMTHFSSRYQNEEGICDGELGKKEEQSGPYIVELETWQLWQVWEEAAVNRGVGHCLGGSEKCFCFVFIFFLIFFWGGGYKGWEEKWNDWEMSRTEAHVVKFPKNKKKCYKHKNKWKYHSKIKHIQII